MAASIQYRPDIDGLRAISVIAVILFHARLGLPGGFVGVDVFFVISGFLITSLILKELDAGAFSLARFWERRVKRIWPAAAVTTLVVLVAGGFLSLPNQWRIIANDAIAHLAFSANVYFWLSGDYFAPASETRQLLHMWSLAVEEQFYIVYPIVLIVVHRIRPRALLAVVAALAVASFAFSIWLVERDRSAAFYLLPTRAWELAIGAILAIGPIASYRLSRGNSVLAIAGLGLIVWSCVTYSNLTPFPGLAAVPPCLGAAMVIVAGRDPSCLATRALSIAPMRVTGLMSYSLYLWHWPVLVFMGSLPLDAERLDSKVAALLLMVILAFFSWRFVETPLRRTRVVTGPKVVIGAAAALSAVLMVLAFGVRQMDGIPSRFRDEVVAHATRATGPSVSGHPDTVVSRIGDWEASSGTPDFLVWGDSHAMAIGRLVGRVAPDRGLTGAGAYRGGAVPIPGVWRPRDKDNPIFARLPKWTSEVEEWIVQNRPRHVVLVARWSYYIGSGPQDVRMAYVAPVGVADSTPATALTTVRAGLRELIDRIEAMGASVWIALEVPLQSETPWTRALGAHFGGTEIPQFGISRVEHEANQELVLQLMSSLNRPSVRFFDLADGFFDAEDRSRVTIDESVSAYYDRDHVSNEGAKALLSGIVCELMDTIVSESN